MPSASPAPLRVAIVGGGVGGLCTAVGLLNEAKRTGCEVEVTIFEQASKFGEIGAGVSMGLNAVKALRMIGAGEALQKAAKERDPKLETWFDFHIAQRDHKTPGAYICTIESGKEGEGNMNVHRADLLDELVALLPPSIAQFRKRCKSYTNTPSGTVRIDFEDGTAAEADVLIAADGIKSLIRRQIWENKDFPEETQRATYSKWVAWRGLIPVETYEAVMGKERAKKIMHLGKGAHILTFPVRGGTLVNLVAFVQDNEEKKLEGRTGPWSEERPKEEMLEDFAGFTDECLALLKAIPRCSVWGIWAIPAIDTISDGNVLLIGDAAHSMTPHQGAGAGQATEDALFISRLLTAPAVAHVSDRPKAIRRALEAYEKARHQHSLDVQRTSRECGLLYEFCGVNGEGDDVEKLKASLEYRLRWIWDYDLEKAAEEAVQSL
ncbi:hypothetical protein JCM8547_006878 [Rhodosporidiobolus lusitaniae]